MLHRRHWRELNSATLSEPNTCGPACMCLILRDTRIPLCGEAICSTILLYITRLSAPPGASTLWFLLVNTWSVTFWSWPRHPLYKQQVTISNIYITPGHMADKGETDADHGSAHEVSSLKATRTIDPGAGPDGPRRMVPPEIIGNMTPEHRAAVEKRLKRKIDLRLLPSLIVMYILNYIDRCVCPVQSCRKERRGGSPRHLGTTSLLLHSPA